MPVADNDGVGIAYERDGTPEGETVVFVEGLGFGRWMWHWQREALADDFDLLLWDNRGTGESDEPEGPYSVAEMAEDLATVLDDAGVETTHVVGASMGGMIAQAFALADGDRVDSLALLCTTHGGESAVDVPPETRKRMFDVPPGYDAAEAIRYKMRPALTDAFWTDSADLIDRIVDWRLASDAPDRAREWQAAAVEAFDSSDRLAGIDAPTLVLHGERDRVVPVENGRQLAAALPDARLETYDEGGSHLFFVERAEGVNGRLRTFLERV